MNEKGGPGRKGLPAGVGLHPPGLAEGQLNH